MLKFEFCKSDKMRIYQLISSPEAHEKNSGKTFKTDGDVPGCTST